MQDVNEGASSFRSQYHQQSTVSLPIEDDKSSSSSQKGNQPGIYTNMNPGIELNNERFKATLAVDTNSETTPPNDEGQEMGYIFIAIVLIALIFVLCWQAYVRQGAVTWICGTLVACLNSILGVVFTALLLKNARATIITHQKWFKDRRLWGFSITVIVLICLISFFCWQGSVDSGENSWLFRGLILYFTQILAGVVSAFLLNDTRARVESQVTPKWYKDCRFWGYFIAAIVSSCLLIVLLWQEDVNHGTATWVCGGFIACFAAFLSAVMSGIYGIVCPH